MLTAPSGPREIDTTKNGKRLRKRWDIKIVWIRLKEEKLSEDMWIKIKENGGEHYKNGNVVK